MNAIKTYKIANRKKFQVEFGAMHGGKWCFRVGSFTLITKVKGGKEVAFKVAEAIHKSYHRHGKIDQTCRNVIDRLLKVRTIADWEPEVDWWTNLPGETSAVVMVEPDHRDETIIPWHVAAPRIEMEPA